MSYPYPDFLNFYYKYKDEHRDQRAGQAAFNAALDYSSDTRGLATLIVATSVDPFHNDNHLGIFLEYMRLAME